MPAAPSAVAIAAASCSSRAWPAPSSSTTTSDRWPGGRARPRPSRRPPPPSRAVTTTARAAPDGADRRRCRQRVVAASRLEPFGSAGAVPGLRASPRPSRSSAATGCPASARLRAALRAHAPPGGRRCWPSRLAARSDAFSHDQRARGRASTSPTWSRPTAAPCSSLVRRGCCGRWTPRRTPRWSAPSRCPAWARCCSSATGVVAFGVRYVSDDEVGAPGGGYNRVVIAVVDVSRPAAHAAAVARWRSTGTYVSARAGRRRAARRHRASEPRLAVRLTDATGTPRAGGDEAGAEPRGHPGLGPWPTGSPTCTMTEGPSKGRSRAAWSSSTSSTARPRSPGSACSAC